MSAKVWTQEQKSWRAKYVLLSSLLKISKRSTDLTLGFAFAFQQHHQWQVKREFPVKFQYPQVHKKNSHRASIKGKKKKEFFLKKCIKRKNYSESLLKECQHREQSFTSSKPFKKVDELKSFKFSHLPSEKAKYTNTFQLAQTSKEPQLKHQFPGRQVNTLRGHLLKSLYKSALNMIALRFLRQGKDSLH